MAETGHPTPASWDTAVGETSGTNIERPRAAAAEVTSTTAGVGAATLTASVTCAHHTRGQGRNRGSRHRHYKLAGCVMCHDAFS